MRARRLLSIAGLVLGTSSIGIALSASAEMHRIGFLVSGSSRGPVATATGDGLVRALAAHGYARGAILSLECRFAEG